MIKYFIILGGRKQPLLFILSDDVSEELLYGFIKSILENFSKVLTESTSREQQEKFSNPNDLLNTLKDMIRPVEINVARDRLTEFVLMDAIHYNVKEDKGVKFKVAYVVIRGNSKEFKSLV